MDARTGARLTLATVIVMVSESWACPSLTVNVTLWPPAWLKPGDQVKTRLVKLAPAGRPLTEYVRGLPSTSVALTVKLSV